MRHIYIQGLYMKDVLRFSRFVENSAGGIRCEGLPFSFAPVKKVPESGHWSHYLQLLSHLCSFVLQSVQANPSSPAALVQAPSHSRLCDPAAEKNAVRAARSYPPHMEDFHEPPFAAGSGKPLVSLSQLCLSNQNTNNAVF